MVGAALGVSVKVLVVSATAVMMVAGLAIQPPAVDAGTPRSRAVATAPPSRVDTPRSGRAFPDPAVAVYRGGLVAVGTGPRAPRMVSKAANAPWHNAGRALTRKPRWAVGDGVWGVDLVHVGRRWLLYYAAPVRGLGREGRCIGVAVSRRALGGYTPVGAPLVCPAGARTGRASDRVRPVRGRLPHRGVIDPSVFRLGKSLFLVYKTQGLPSTIRVVRLTHRGLRTAHTSHELIRVGHIVENPVLYRQGRRFVLLTSEGSYDSCGYRTVWRASRHLLRWARSRPHLLLGRGSGVCGPGGADVVVRHAGPVLVFHGWACGRFASRCPSGTDSHLQGRRTLYAARLVFRRGRLATRPLPPLKLAPDDPTPMIEVPVHHRHHQRHPHRHRAHRVSRR